MTTNYLMKDTDLRQERDRELYSLYLRGLREQHFNNMHEAADWVRSQPASKFYISSKALVNYIGAKMRGSVPPKMFSENRKKVRLLYQMYLDFMEKNPDCNLSRERICEALVDEPAPMFFICHDSCLKVLLRERNRHRDGLAKKYGR